MIGNRINLETFEFSTGRTDHIFASTAEIEAGQLSAYERGYAAGWDDCVTSKENEKDTLRLEVLRRIHQLTSSYGDIREECSSYFLDILSDAIQKAVPCFVGGAIRSLISDYFQNIPIDIRGARICITVHPSMSDFIEGMDLTDVEIVGNSAYGVGEISISQSAGGICVDFNEFFTKILEEIYALKSHAKVI
ncbi:MAG TPA: hypothetical protein VGC40_08765 [Paenirhodobacter sp.]